MIKKLIFFICLSLVVVTVHAQETKEEIQKKQQQLLQEITQLNQTLNQIKKNKKQSLTQLALVQRKIQARQELVNNINRDLRRLDDNIYTNQLQIYRLKNELDTLKGQYAKSIVFAYQNRSNYDYLNFLFSAASFNDAVKRIAYLKSYRQYRETQVSNIQKTQALLLQQIQTLNFNKEEKSTSLKEQSKQLTVLADDRKEKDLVVKELKNQENDIAAQLKDKERTRQKLAQALQTIIKREIEAAKKKEQERLAKLKKDEEDKKKAQAQSGTTAKTDNKTTTDNSNVKSNTEVSGGVTSPKSNRVYSPFESTTEEANVSINFENGRGRLPWPIDQGMVSTHFGPYQIPDTKLKGDMPGVEISLPIGANVKAVADGVVSAVFDMGTGQAIVIRHGKYFTTYSNITNPAVEKGQQVKAGKILGRSAAGFSGEGQIIFMVTNEKNVNLNPESWLKPR